MEPFARRSNVVCIWVRENVGALTCPTLGDAERSFRAGGADDRGDFIMINSVNRPFRIKGELSSYFFILAIYIEKTCYADNSKVGPG